MSSIRLSEIRAEADLPSEEYQARHRDGTFSQDALLAVLAEYDSLRGQLSDARVRLISLRATARLCLRDRPRKADLLALRKELEIL